MNLQECKDSLAKETFGITKGQAVDRGVCINCQQPVHFVKQESEIKEGAIYTDAGQREYAISGMCEYCFDNLFKEF